MTQREVGNEHTGGGAKLFWYTENWMQRLYSEGIESGLRWRERNPPICYIDGSGKCKKRGDCMYFYWTPIDSAGEVSWPKDSGINGYRMYAIQNESKEGYSAVVEIRKGEG